MKLSNEQMYAIYLMMKRCRAFEERAIVELRKGMPGFIHSSIGAEAIPCGISPFLAPDDYILTTHRGHSDIIARGAGFIETFAELYAKRTGYCKGVAGSMHIAALDLNILGATGIVGSGVPLSSGVALGCKMQKNNRITVCYLGDGATCTGAFHEGVTFAATFDLPVLFVIVNNQYEESTHWTYWGGKLKNLAERAKGYGLKGYSVDGNDALSVAKIASQLVPKIRKGAGPIILEAVTYRIHGHHMGDPSTSYRPKEEIEAWKSPEKDPIGRLYTTLRDKGLINEEQDRQIDVELEAELDEAVRLALDSPEIDPQEVLQDFVYYNRHVESLQKV